MNIQWHDTIASHAAAQSVLRALNTRLTPITSGADFCVPAWRVWAVSNGDTLCVCEDDAAREGYHIVTVDPDGNIGQIATLSGVYDAEELLRFVRSILATL